MVTFECREYGLIYGLRRGTNPLVTRLPLCITLYHVVSSIHRTPQTLRFDHHEVSSVADGGMTLILGMRLVSIISKSALYTSTSSLLLVFLIQRLSTRANGNVDLGRNLKPKRSGNLDQIQFVDLIHRLQMMRGVCL